MTELFSWTRTRASVSVPLDRDTMFTITFVDAHDADSLQIFYEGMNAKHARIVKELQEETRQLQEILADAGEEYGWQGALAKNPPLRPSEAERRLQQVADAIPRLRDQVKPAFPAALREITAICDGLQTPVR